jgi:uncharacterized protein (TIGR00299 family) protein
MTIYLDCTMGASGDMLMGALYELLPDGELFLERMRALGLPGVDIDAERTVKRGVAGTKMRIKVDGEEETYPEDALPDHPHTHDHACENGHDGAPLHPHEQVHRHYSYKEVADIITGLDLADNVKADALAVYRILGEAEAEVHGVSPQDIAFHEVGSMDAIADIVGCCLLFQMLGPDKVEASAVHVGSGFVRCAHGLLPVPTPATARILQGVPIYGGRIQGELCTPTGAALLKHFVRRFGEMAPMAVSKIGYGMGTKDFEAPNCVRAFLSDRKDPQDTVAEITCNLDDMTSEAIGFATQLLLDAGALDVFTTPVYMKKNRPSVLLTCLCRPDDRHEMTRLMLTHTTTLGVRYRNVLRDVMEVSTHTVETAYGKIRIKTGRGHGIKKRKPEYEDVKAAAEAHNVPFNHVWLAAITAMAAEDKD